MEQKAVRVTFAKERGAWWRFKTTFKWSFLILIPVVIYWLYW